MLTAIVGINWGDEGKGRMVDLLSEGCDVVVRYQGGNNAGHTVINEKGRFALNLLPSGILRSQTVNVMGNGMVVDLEHLCGEIASLREKGVDVTPDNLKLSDKAVLCLPFHKLMDQLEERRLADKKYGSTQRGIAPAYSDKYMKKALRAEDLFLGENALRDKIAALCEWKNLTVQKGYGEKPVEPAAVLDWLEKYGGPIKEYVADTSALLYRAARARKRILFEGQLGALRDIDFGIYPYTTSSSTIAAYAPIGAGVPGLKLDKTVGIMKAYSSCVGEGPFTVEFSGKEAELLREAGGEYGAATGRPRRVGPFDVPASRYGCGVQGADCLALTKLDVLSYMDKIPVCTAYQINGKITTEFPSGENLAKAKPIVEYREGFKRDISGCRKAADLPKAAFDYVKYVEKTVGCPVKYVSVGPERGQIIVM
ncbi:MAG: adenylosuccinate synthase [Clostridiales bacterium]|jgi:adenylosuccinate synthase|nr:adenylosuccinate synthase [Clostridiales bacterium]